MSRVCSFWTSRPRRWTCGPGRSSDRPNGGSARNVGYGPVTSISVEGERARVRVGSSPPVVAEVTLGSVGRLRLAVGRDVWVSFKAVEVDIRLPAGTLAE